MPTNDQKKQRAYLLSSSVNLILPPLKLIAGIIGHSTALIADAINSFGDIASNIVVYLFLRLSSRPRDKDHAYGHGKYETVATLFIGVMMCIAGILIVVNSASVIERYFTRKELPTPSEWIALVVAGFTLVLKAIAYFYTHKQGIETKSEALMAQAQDHRNDVFSALAVALGVTISRLWGGVWSLAEPIAAIIVAGFIIYFGIGICIPALRKLTEAAIPDETIEDIKNLILGVDGVSDPHNIRTRMIGSSTFAIDLDIRVDGNMPLYQAHELTMQCEHLIREKYGEETHINIHVEPAKPFTHIYCVPSKEA